MGCKKYRPHSNDTRNLAVRTVDELVVLKFVLTFYSLRRNKGL